MASARSGNTSKRPLKDSRFWDHPTAPVLVVCVLLLVFGAVRWLLGTALKDLLFEGLLLIVLVSIGVLKALYPKFSRFVEKGFLYYFSGTLLLMALLTPMTLALWASRWALADLHQTGQIVFFAFAVALWCLVLATIAYKRWRTTLFHRLADLGWVLPLIFLFNYMMVSVILFGCIGFLSFCDADQVCTIGDTVHTGVAPERFFDLFLWHVLDAVPVLDIPGTLPWPEPLDYGRTPSLLGVLLTVFKLAVIVPGIAAFTSYWQQRTAVQA